MNLTYSTFNKYLNMLGTKINLFTVSSNNQTPNAASEKVHRRC